MGMQLTFAESTAIVIALTALAEIWLQLFRFFARKSRSRALLPIAVASGDCSEHLERAMDRRRGSWIRCVAAFAFLVRLFYLVVPDLIQNQTSEKPTTRFRLVEAGTPLAKTARVRGTPGALPNLFSHGVIGEPFPYDDVGMCSERVSTSLASFKLYSSVGPGVTLWCFSGDDAYADDARKRMSVYPRFNRSNHTLGTYYIFWPGRPRVTAIRFASSADDRTYDASPEAFERPGQTVHNYAAYAGSAWTWNSTWERHDSAYDAVDALAPDEYHACEDAAGFSWIQDDAMLQVFAWHVEATLENATSGLCTLAKSYSKYNITVEEIEASYNLTAHVGIVPFYPGVDPTVDDVASADTINYYIFNVSLGATYPVVVYNPIVVVVVMAPIIAVLVALAALAFALWLRRPTDATLDPEPSGLTADSKLSASVSLAASDAE